MLNINFIPEDYIQSNESCRTNLMYLALFGVVMLVLGGLFVTIKIRQRVADAGEVAVNGKLEQAEKAIQQFEEVQRKRKKMIKTALTTAELLEPVPQSVLLACLTNNLPPGVSLLRVSLVQKAPERTYRSSATSKFDKARSKKTPKEQQPVSAEKLLQTYIEIEGVAPSDLQVAAYIEKLGNSALLQKVALVQSEEYINRKSSRAGSGKPEAWQLTLRDFELTAMLRENVHLSTDDIDSIRAGHSGPQKKRQQEKPGLTQPDRG